MPELPEVEEYGRYLRRYALHRRIARADVRDERILGATRRDAFVRKLRGRMFMSVRRHGKHLFVLTDGGPALHMHFGMSGDLTFYRDVNDEPRWARVVFDFDDGTHLAFEDMRLFGVLELLDDVDTYIAEHHLGIDVLDRKLRLAGFGDALREHRGAIKALLMSQEVVAGLGNLYVDETLYEAGVNPRRAADSIDDDAVRTMFTAMRRIARKPVRKMPREEGDRCPRCGGTIRRATVFGRTTYFCAKHQR